MHINLHVTDVASDYLASVIEKQQGVGLRLTIKKTGCSGFSYAPAVVKTVDMNDIVMIISPHVTLYIDPAWAHLLNGVEIDFIEEDKSGLKQKRLTFTNPNESSRCGCGESFHIE